MDIVITEAFLHLDARLKNQKVLGESEKIKIYLWMFPQREMLRSMSKSFLVTQSVLNSTLVHQI